MLKKMLKKLILLLLVISPFISSAQYRHFRAKRFKTSTSSFYRRKNNPRPELILGVGASNFLGELGGANQTGTFFVRDLEIKATAPSAQIAGRFKLNNHFAIKGGLYYELVKGSDKLTKEPYRQNRNLSFKSNIFELSLQGEFFLTREQQGARYKIKNARGFKSYDFQAYLFLGVGGFYFNPKAFYYGSWENLQPLGTEGQGLPGQKAKYSRVAFCIPYGIGVKEAINRYWSVGVEVGMRKTFTDYIDDVSGVYYDNNKLRAARGDMAADLADPSLSNLPAGIDGNGYQTAAGEVRGHSQHKDAYMFLNVTFSYKIPKKQRMRFRY